MVQPNKKVFVARYGLVYMHTDICASWRRHHENCCGCKHEKQCSKYTNWTKQLLDNLLNSGQSGESNDI